MDRWLDKWLDRLYGAGVAIVVALLVFFLDQYGVWDKLWYWSGLWRYIH